MPLVYRCTVYAEGRTSAKTLHWLERPLHHAMEDQGLQTHLASMRCAAGAEQAAIRIVVLVMYTSRPRLPGHKGFCKCMRQTLMYRYIKERYISLSYSRLLFLK